jgi:hypothetical protein
VKPIPRPAFFVPMIALVALATVASCGGQSTSSANPSVDAAGSTDRTEASEDASDAGVCDLLAYRPQLVCFGAGVSDYAKYLIPDAGIGVGQCPTAGAFRSSVSEGTCGYSACGPLLQTAIPPDAGLDGGSSCCFWAISICGV